VRVKLGQAVEVPKFLELKVKPTDALAAVRYKA
jgi:hypothetical protein